MTRCIADVIILSAAAGLMCGKQAHPVAEVLLIDHAEQWAKKILISGGGRCNFAMSAP
jgi:predicted flavoprotein YhiN